MQKNKITVTELNKYIANTFNSDFFLKNVCVCGEVSNFKISNGIAYFNLKDSNSYISCLVFNSILLQMKFQLEEGQNIVVHGRVSVYEPTGRYSIIISHIEKEGIGKLYEEYEKLKSELEEKGMFDKMYKKNIPKYNMNVGIVTSETGAVIEDMKRIIFQKNPHINITLFPSLVQGDNAAETIIEGIEVLDELNLDVIIVGRGGGSFEDLNCFNDEKLAYAVFNANTPIVSAVGHEVDTTIIDFVSDLRCATPTEAADKVSWSMDELYDSINEKLSDISNIFYSKFSEAENNIFEYESKIKYLSPKSKLENYQNTLSQYSKNIKTNLNNKLQHIKLKLDSKIKLLDAASPLKKLQKGFGYLEDKHNKKINSINDVQENDLINIFVKDGKIITKVERKEYAK